MAVCYLITGEYGGFTFLSALLFFYISFLTIAEFCPKYKVIACCCYALCLVYFGFSIYVEMSIGCVTALLALLLIILRIDHTALASKKGGLVWYSVVCFYLWLCIIGFRQNAFTVLPVVIYSIIRLSIKIKAYWSIVIHTITTILAVLTITLLPLILNFGFKYGKGSKYMGLVWEMVCMIKEMPDKYEYMSMLDYLGEEEGATLLGVTTVNYNSINSVNTYLSNYKAGQGNNGNRIIKNYLYLLKNETKTFFLVKGRFIARTLGISQPLDNVEYDYNRDERMGEFNMKDTKLRRGFHDIYNRFLDSSSFIRMPWLVFSVVLALILLVKRIVEKELANQLMTVYFTAVFFYSSFLITVQSQEFRYFFVPLVLLTSCCFCCLEQFICFLLYQHPKKLKETTIA